MTQRVGVLGASSLVGKRTITHLLGAGWTVHAFSRRAVRPPVPGIHWHPLAQSGPSCSSPTGEESPIPWWVVVAPIWVLPDYFPLLQAYGVRRVVALSSTSRFTKAGSTDAAESALAAQLKAGEEQLCAWAESQGIEWVVLRPTMIYGWGQDKNVCAIARFIRWFGFFPLFGSAQGLRQPVHVDDVAAAAVAALRRPAAAGRTYHLSGCETLPYREMVVRIFQALGQPVRLVSVPLWGFRFVVAALRLVPRYRHWSAAMAERMNHDLVFDHHEAARDLAFQPRGFELSADDLPR